MGSQLRARAEGEVLVQELRQLVTLHLQQEESGGMLVFPGCFPLNSFWDPSLWMVPARLGAGLSSITCLWKIPSQTPTAVFSRTPNSVKLTIKHNHHAILSNDIIIFSQATREMLNISTGSKAYKQSSENPQSPY